MEKILDVYYVLYNPKEKEYFKEDWDNWTKNFEEAKKFYSYRDIRDRKTDYIERIQILEIKTTRNEIQS